MNKCPLLLLISLIATLITSSLHGDESVRAFWPSYPYRLWYGADLKNKPELYPNLNVTTSGNAYDAHQAGKTSLGWIFGSNWKLGYGTGPDYWEQRFLPERLIEEAKDGRAYDIIRAGVAMDEWTGTKHKEIYDWIDQGTREGKKNRPETFVAIWLSGGADILYEMGHDGTADLFLIQGYELTKDRGLGVPWCVAIERLEEFNQRGLMRKTVFSLGHITDEANWKDGWVWTEEKLRNRLEDLKLRFPDMPGISFFNAGAVDQKNYDELAQLVDRLSGEYWPALPLADGVYNLVSQKDSQYRIEAADSGERPGTPVQLNRPAYPNPAEHQKWRFKNLDYGNYRIQPAYTDELSLAAYGHQIGLAATDQTTEQVWRLEHTGRGFRLIPFKQLNKRLSFSEANEGSPLTLTHLKDDEATVWAFKPEVSSFDPIPPYYQAEDARLDGGANQSTENAGSMGGYVTLDSNDDTIEYPAIDGGTGGSKRIGIRYANGHDDEVTINIKVNGKNEPIQMPPTQDWRTWRTLRVPVTLNAKENNEVIFNGPKEASVNVDKITVFPQED